MQLGPPCELRSDTSSWRRMNTWELDPLAQLEAQGGVRDESCRELGMTQWCWGCGWCWICCRWPHADGVPSAKVLVNQPAGLGEGGVVKYEVSCDWSFQPPQYLAIWQEGLQLAEASWIVICINLVISCQIFLRTSWRDQESPESPESTLNQPHFFKVLKVRTSRLCSNINPTARLLRGRMYLGLHVLHLRWGRTTGYWKAWLSMEYLHLQHQYTEHRGFHGFIPWFHVISCNNTAQT